MLGCLLQRPLPRFSNVAAGGAVVLPPVRMAASGLARNGPGIFQSLKVIGQGTAGPINVYDGIDATGTLILNVAAPVTGQSYAPASDYSAFNVYVTHGGVSQTVDYTID